MAQPTTTVYVGGLDPTITEPLLKATFISFGPIREVYVPLDGNENRGYGFVEYEDKSDAADAIDNMHDAEMLGKRIRVRFARGSGGRKKKGEAVWDEEEGLEINDEGIVDGGGADGEDVNGDTGAKR